MKIQIANHKSQIANGRRAFTLVEMLLVVTIIGILAALVVPKIMGRSEQARVTAAHADISGIKTALDAFEVDNGYYPKGNNGLGDLVQAPRDARNWHGPYLDRIPTDPCSPDCPNTRSEHYHRCCIGCELLPLGRSADPFG